MRSCPAPASHHRSLSSLWFFPLLSVHRDLSESRGLGHAGLTDSNQLEEREKGDHGFQPCPGMAEDGTEIELRLTRQHLPEFLELLAERDVLHLDGDLARRWQAVEHLPEGAGQRVEAHLHSRL